MGWPETEEKKGRRQVTPNKCGRHVCLYERNSPPSVPFGFLPSSARRFPSRRRGCNEPISRSGVCWLAALTSTPLPMAPPRPPPPPEVTRPVNPQGHQCGDLGGRTFALAPSPDPTMVISLTPSSHSHSFVASSLRRQVRHVRGHCAPLQQLVRDLSTRRTQYVRSSGSLLRLGNQRSRPWLRRRDRGTRDAGHSGLRSSAPSRPRDATLQPLAGHARIHPHIGIQPVALGVLIAEDHQESM